MIEQRIIRRELAGLLELKGENAYKTRAYAGRGWALVGDAGYHKDPITGYGITDALRDAELLAEAAGAGLAGREPMEQALAARQLALGGGV